MLFTADDKLSVRCKAGTPPSCQRAFCRPSLRLSKTLRIADRSVLPVRVRQHEMIDHMGKRSPPILIPNSVICVKSEAHNSARFDASARRTLPGAVLPSTARFSPGAAGSVTARPRTAPGNPSATWRTVSSLPGRGSLLSCSRIRSQTSLKGSSRVRQSRSAFTSLGNFRRRKYLRAVFVSMPALAAAISWLRSVFDNFFSLLIWLVGDHPAKHSPIKRLRHRLNSLQIGKFKCRQQDFSIFAEHFSLPTPRRRHPSPPW